MNIGEPQKIIEVVPVKVPDHAPAPEREPVKTPA